MSLFAFTAMSVWIQAWDPHILNLAPVPPGSPRRGPREGPWGRGPGPPLLPGLPITAPRLRGRPRCRAAAGFPTLTARLPSRCLPRATRSAPPPRAGARPQQRSPRPGPPAAARAVLQSALRLGRPGSRARAGTRALRRAGAEGASRGRGRRGRRSRCRRPGSRSPCRSPAASPEPREGERFLPACSGRRDLTPRWRTARTSTRPKRAACLFSTQR